MVPLPPGRGGDGRAAWPRGRREPGCPGDGAGSLRQGRVCRGPGAVLRVHWPVRESREVTIARAARRGAARGVWVVLEPASGPGVVPWSPPKRFPPRSCPSGRGTPWSSQRPGRPEAAFLGREGGRPRGHSDVFAFRTRRFRLSTSLSTVPAPSRPVSVYQNVTAHSPKRRVVNMTSLQHHKIPFCRISSQR